MMSFQQRIIAEKYIIIYFLLVLHSITTVFTDTAETTQAVATNTTATNVETTQVTTTTATTINTTAQIVNATTHTNHNVTTVASNATTVDVNATISINTTESDVNSTTNEVIVSTIASTTAQTTPIPTTPLPTTATTTIKPTTPVPTTKAATTQPSTVKVTTPSPTTTTTEKSTTQPATEAPTTKAPTTAEPTTQTVFTTEAISTTTAEVICNVTSEDVLVSLVRTDVTCTDNTNSEATAGVNDTVTIFFPVTRPGNYGSANQSCTACENANKPIAMRYCDEQGAWKDPIYLECSLGIADIVDESQQAQATLVSTSTLSSSDVSGATTAISIVDKLSKSSSVTESDALVALEVVGNLLGATGETLGAVVGKKEVVRNAISSLAGKIESNMEEGYSAYSLSVKFLTSLSRRRRKRHSFCTETTVGTNIHIDEDSQLTDIKLITMPKTVTEYDYYALGKNCGEESGYVFVMYGNGNLFEATFEDVVNGPVFYVGSTNDSFVGSVEVKVQVFQKFADFVDSVSNGTHKITTSIKSTCAIWDEPNSKWSYVACKTEVAAGGVKCDCDNGGNIAVLKRTQVSYEVIPADNSLSTGEIVGIVLGSIAGFILLITIIVCIYKVKKKHERKILPSGDQGYEMENSRRSTPTGFATD